MRVVLLTDCLKMFLNVPAVRTNRVLARESVVHVPVRGSLSHRVRLLSDIVNDLLAHLDNIFVIPRVTPQRVEKK